MYKALRSSSIKRLAKQTRKIGRSKIQHILRALRTTNGPHLPAPGDNKCTSIDEGDSSGNPRFGFEEHKVEEGLTSPSSRSSTPSLSYQSSSPDSEASAMNLPRERVSAVGDVHDDPFQKGGDHWDGAVSELASRLRSHQIEWAAMIELERSDVGGLLQGMSARQIRRLIQQKRNEAWLTQTDGPLYESEEEHFSEDMMRQNSSCSASAYYDPVLELTEDEDWSLYF